MCLGCAVGRHAGLILVKTPNEHSPQAQGAAAAAACYHQHEIMSAIYEQITLRQMIYFRMTDRWGVGWHRLAGRQHNATSATILHPTVLANATKAPEGFACLLYQDLWLADPTGFFSAAALPGTNHCLWRGCGFPACDFLDRCADWRPVTVEDCDREGHQLRRCRLKRY